MSHYRVINGQTTYNAEGAEQGRPAEIYERTAIGKCRQGSFYLRASNADDKRQILKAAQEAGVETINRRAGANHFGRVAAYDHVHCETIQGANAIMEALGRPVAKSHVHASQRTVNGKLVQVKEHDNKVQKAQEASKKAHEADSKMPAYKVQKEDWLKSSEAHEAAYHAHRDAYDETGDREHAKKARYHLTTASMGSEEGRSIPEHAKWASKKAEGASNHSNAKGGYQNHANAANAHAHAATGHFHASVDKGTPEEDKAMHKAKSDYHSKMAKHHHSKAFDAMEEGNGVDSAPKEPLDSGKKEDAPESKGEGSEEKAKDPEKIENDKPDPDNAKRDDGDPRDDKEGREIHKSMVERDAQRIDYQMTQVGKDPIALEALAMRKRAILGQSNEQ